MSDPRAEQARGDQQHDRHDDEITVLDASERTTLVRPSMMRARSRDDRAHDRAHAPITTRRTHYIRSDHLRADVIDWPAITPRARRAHAKPRRSA